MPLYFLLADDEAQLLLPRPERGALRLDDFLSLALHLRLFSALIFFELLLMVCKLHLTSFDLLDGLLDPPLLALLLRRRFVYLILIYVPLRWPSL